MTGSDPRTLLHPFSMNRLRVFAFPSATLLVASALLLACNGGETDSDDGGGAAGGSSGSGGAAAGTGGSSGGSALVTRLSACPVVGTSSDPTASVCLVGSYEGKTLGGEDCTLTLGEDGAYEFTSPTLSHDRLPIDDTLFVYDYTKVQETNLLTWFVNDPLSADVYYELDFEARFGAQIPESDRKIEIEVSRTTTDTMDSVVCIVEL